MQDQGFSSIPTLLVVDDDTSNLESLKLIFEKERYRVLCAPNGRDALDLLRSERVDVVLTDLMMPGMSGLELLRSIKTISPLVEVVLMTAYGTVERAVEAMKQGAYDFVTKPFKRIQIVKGVRRAMEKQSLLNENLNLREQLKNVKESTEIIGNSRAIKRMMDMIRQVAPSQATVLIQGESGTGKELVAREIHRLSRRADKSIIPFNCAALPRELAEAELFGHEKGAYSGAHKARPGLFREADGGTLFLDEISELELGTQGKLLRAIQEGEIKPVGGARTTYVDVRLITASKNDLEDAVAKGLFREDLYYRLNVIKIVVEPLRFRQEDIILLATHFLRTLSKRNGKVIHGFSPEVAEALVGYDWPGNVRELENVMERAVVLNRGELIQVDDLPPQICRSTHPSTSGPIEIPFGTTMEEVEQTVLKVVLDRVDGDKKLAADILGISQRTVYRMLDRRGAGTPGD